MVLTLKSQSLLPHTEVEQPCNNNVLANKNSFPSISRLLILTSFLSLYCSQDLKPSCTVTLPNPKVLK